MAVAQRIPPPVARFEYRPRRQFIDFHQRDQRWAAIVAHRRVGKTVAAVNDLVLRALYNPRKNPRYAYIAPFYGQAKDVAWQYLKDATSQFARRVRESDLRVELPNDAFITLYGADNPDALRGLYLDGVVLDEYGDTKPSLWPEVVLPTLSDRKGFAVFIGTAKGKNHFHATVVRARQSPSWFHRTFKASETHVLPPEELQELREQMSAAQYARELECDFDAAVPGTYYADLITELEQSQRIHPTLYPPDLNYPVHIAADLGFSDSTAFWFWQVLPDGPRVIDYYENQSKPLSHYVTHLRQKPYRYDTFWLPHDARAHTLQTGRTTVEQLQQDKFHVRIAPNVRVQHGIDAGRYVLPRLTINSSACYSGIEALRAYRRRYDEKNKAYADTPLHDWSCLTGETRIWTRYGMRQIMALPETGEVMTLCGWKPYHSPRLTRRDAPLVRVTFDDGFTVSCTPEHRFLTESGWRFAADLTMGMLIRSCSMDSPNTSMGDFIDSTGVTTPEEENCFTEQRGSLLSAPFPGGITSIIEMVIRITTTFRISNAFRPMSISARASARGLQPARFASGSWLVAALPNGIVLKPGDFGIDDMPRGQRAGPSGSESLAPAFGVNESLRRSFERMAGCRSSARTPARPRTIANVKLLHDVADVWCLTVPEIGHFCLENGAIVHNSNGADAFRYMSLVVKTELKIDTTASERFAASPQVTGWTLDELFEDYDKHRVRLNEGRI